MKVLEIIRKVLHLDESTSSPSSKVQPMSEGQTPSVRDRYTAAVDQINRFAHVTSNAASIVSRTALSYLPEVGDIDAAIDRGPQIASAAKEMLKRSAEYFDLDLIADQARLGALLLKTLQTELPAFRMQ